MAVKIEISQFSFRYGKASPLALNNISFGVEPGCICALLGPTNSGKSTLLHAIAGILGSHHREAAASGSITIGSEPYSPLPQKVLFPLVGLTIQDPYFQISGLRDSVLEEVSLTLECLGVSVEEARDRCRQLLDSLALTHLIDRKPVTLSGGELQRAALATILIARPPVLLLDEPSGALDGKARRQLASFVCSLRETTTMIISDNQLELAMMTADQFVVLDGGQLVFCGDRHQFIDNLGRFRALLPIDQWI
ncbi:MAG TPA: ABC transporter ATP-binding protein, partial [Bacteroidota bacterium]